MMGNRVLQILQAKNSRRAIWGICVAALTVCILSFPSAQWLAQRGAYQSSGYSRLLDSVETDLLETQMSNLENALWQSGNPAMPDISSWDYEPNFFYTIQDDQGAILSASETLGDYRAKDMTVFTTEGQRESTSVQEHYNSEEERTLAILQLESQYEMVEYHCEDITPGVTEAEAGESSEAEESSEAKEPAVESNIIYALYATCWTQEESNIYTVSGYLRYDMVPSGMVYAQITQAQTLYAWRFVPLAAVLIGAILGLLSLAGLALTTGRKPNTDAIDLSSLDKKLPTDGLLLGMLLLLLILVCFSGNAPCPLFILLIQTPFLALDIALLCAGVLSLVRRVRAGVWKDALFLHHLAWLRRLWQAFCQKLPLLWGGLLVFLLCSLFELFCIALLDSDGAWLLLWVAGKLLEGGGLIWVLSSMRILQEGGRKLAAGDLAYQVPIKHLKWAFRVHGEHLNRMRTAIQAAVEEQMKSERMKTELITNVSHDIKTPLTSIVNYVDLLKKQEIPNGKAQEYLDVLDRQSAKLKKLTEDLVEAAKASTGNLTVHAEPTDVNVLLSQSAGEYQEKLLEKNLSLVLTPAPEGAHISADGRLLWRVFENLLSNIWKYALPGTRVYLSCETTAQQVTIVFRNISATPLNLSSEELMERFVRGDASRHTEGSGLGLSIAQSLTQLQNGTFSVAIDGDLFKVTLDFPRLTPPSGQTEPPPFPG